ncbi:hypothetical protein RFI_17802 [Reticulomyxa filosa]|uniref:Uncharacterized protein n=1 Tax=Reticulomyxa filosa TaxID=46433 RepID=X6N060_RETFI|nr:hypothetical protein RFI_17802 [Reticulomyxa filosa]|eukprot:ETO19426.1 hypothetical protein RFI_17802 [Reticulomyxa filosa]
MDISNKTKNGRKRRNEEKEDTCLPLAKKGKVVKKPKQIDSAKLMEKNNSVDKLVTNSNKEKKKKEKKERKNEEDEEEESEDEYGTLHMDEFDEQWKTALLELKEKRPEIAQALEPYATSETQNKTNKSETKNKNKEKKSKKHTDSPPVTTEKAQKVDDEHFLKEYFGKGFWKCNNKKDIKNLPVYKELKGAQEELNLDDVELADDDFDIALQNQFEYECQQKASEWIKDTATTSAQSPQ